MTGMAFSKSFVYSQSICQDESTLKDSFIFLHLQVTIEHLCITFMPVFQYSKAYKTFASSRSKTFKWNFDHALSLVLIGVLTSLQVSKYMGLGAEWKQRWVVVMPRYQAPHPSSPGQQHVARLLLVCYKARDQCDPCCKVWLDGAVARSVTGSLGSGFLQCALVSIVCSRRAQRFDACANATGEQIS